MGRAEGGDLSWCEATAPGSKQPPVAPNERSVGTTPPNPVQPRWRRGGRVWAEPALEQEREPAGWPWQAAREGCLARLRRHRARASGDRGSPQVSGSPHRCCGAWPCPSRPRRSLREGSGVWDGPRSDRSRWARDEGKPPAATRPRRPSTEATADARCFRATCHGWRCGCRGAPGRSERRSRSSARRPTDRRPFRLGSRAARGAPRRADVTR